jgi:hypothetical protein
VRWVIGAAIVVGLAFGITQGVIPNVAESKVKDRLTRNGGSADVTIKAIPAIRLLFDDGDELNVEARRIEIPVRELRGGGLKKLDGFDHMRFEMIRSEIGPFTADRALLKRDEGAKLYDFTFTGSTSAGQLADFALGSLPLALRSLIETVSGRSADAAVPIRLDAQLKSEGGRADLVRGGGSVAGLPIGGIALPIAGAIISRLTG